MYVYGVLGCIVRDVEMCGWCGQLFCQSDIHWLYIVSEKLTLHNLVCCLLARHLF